MSQVILHGPPQSSYLRSARMACAEKGIEHELAPVEFGSEAHAALHPFGKVPVLSHDDVVLYETSAIVRYIDARFDSGTRLVSSDPAAIGRGEQWISALNCYLYDDLVRRYALRGYIFAKNGPDRAVIEEVQPLLERDLGLLEAALTEHAWLGGDDFGIADVMLAPAVQTAAMFPEAQQKLAQHPKVAGWLAAIGSRPSGKYLAPPRP